MLNQKIGKTAYRACWVAFFAVLIGGLYFGYSWLWSWLPLGLAMLVQIVANRSVNRSVNRSANRSTASGDPATTGAPVEVEAPVFGRWRALNSPADKVPSHGTRAYGQAYAIDIVGEPVEGRPRPRFGWWPVVRRAEAFPGFGASVVAVADATVVRVVDGQRDHLSRNSYPALTYLIFEGALRDMAGAARLVGNHVILDLGEGVYALYAHLRRASITVREGERVGVGELLGQCGNSGNSTEPHVHFQLMDHADPERARGLPFTWRGIGVPANGEQFTVADTLSRPGAS
ncbi:M23 family metallopeptidase [Embleya sp. AB8]|uniref:M23 family metallopeptidase n=1 Tax=Embleya sp. AB8 TaxID=3156304 RepID=UPI003C78DCE8